MLKAFLAGFLSFVFVNVSLAEEHSKIHQPTLAPQNSGTVSGLIAVSPVNSRVVWASARDGTFTVTTGGGEHWQAGVVPEAEALQFRDVQGSSEKGIPEFNRRQPNGFSYLQDR